MNRHWLFATGLAAALTLSAPAIVRAQSTFTIPTVNADTVQVSIDSWGHLPVRQGEESHLEKLQHIDVLSDRPNARIRISMAALPDAPESYQKMFKPSFVLQDGRTQYLYLGARKQYQKSTDAKMLAEGEAPPLMGQGIRLLFGLDKNPAKFAPVAGETLDGGKALNVFQRNYTRSLPGGEYTHIEKFWIDPATRLPVRFSAYSKSPDGKESEIARELYSGWKLDAPLDKSLFAWVPPEGSAEYKPVERPPLLAAGTVAPTFSVPKWGGGTLSLADFKGKVVILDFWATWCGPCQMSMPHVEKVFQNTKREDVVVLGVCVWDKQDAYEKWMPEHKDKYSFTFGFDTAGRDPSNIAGKLYKVTGIPTTYVIDRDGKVAASVVGFRDGDTRIEEILGKLGVKVTGAEGASSARRTASMR